MFGRETMWFQSQMMGLEIEDLVWLVGILVKEVGIGFGMIWMWFGRFLK